MHVCYIREVKFPCKLQGQPMSHHLYIINSCVEKSLCWSQKKTGLYCRPNSCPHPLWDASRMTSKRLRWRVASLLLVSQSSLSHFLDLYCFSSSASSMLIQFQHIRIQGIHGQKIITTCAQKMVNHSNSHLNHLFKNCIIYQSINVNEIIT